jgi:hypothetical protein
MTQSAAKRPPLSLWSVDRRTALVAMASAAACAMAVASALSTGGHVSTDSVQQLFEAQTGRSVSWNPPFMSALFALFGADAHAGAGLATAVFVALVAVALWSAPVTVALARSAERVNVLALSACVALMLNPVVLIYAGIVWKDVLFAAFTSIAAAAGLAALGVRPAGGRIALAAIAALVVGLLPLVRQQGWVVGPVLALLPLLAVVWTEGLSSRAKSAAFGLVLVSFLVSHSLAAGWSASVVAGSEGKDMSVGFRAIQSYDLAGMEAFAREGPLVRAGASPAALAELQDHYTPERIDFLDRTPALSAFLASRGGSLGEDWKSAIIDDPAAYLTHRGEVVRALLGGHRVGACLPVHFGVDGFDHQLEALGMARGADAIDRQLYQIAKPWFGTPLFKHASYVVLFGLTLCAIALRRKGRSRISLLLVGVSAVLFYASFVPTAIACDFRYLFPAIPLLTLLAVALLLGWSEATESSETLR